ncbi:MAG: ASKHA domain-containing protein [Desulfurispora sp.]|uniref:ASKHA domain-containing protein n=1 Tax=Desulfurispora sp. TaxID=3014275 RepID=UPI00404B5913
MQNKHTLTLLPGNRKLTAPAGVRLLELLREAGVRLETPCGGRGLCGKCKIRVQGDGLPPLQLAERQHLTAAQLAAGWRLACALSVQCDMVLELPGPSSGDGQGILQAGEMPDYTLDPVLRKVPVRWEREMGLVFPGLGHSLAEALQMEEAAFSAVVLRQLAGLWREAEVVTAVLAGEQVLALEAGDTSAACYGVAVDLGTTTVVAALWDLRAGKEMGTAAALNPQTGYGLDVLTRIDFAAQGETGLKKLQQEVVACLNSLMEQLARQSAIARQQIYEIAVAGNPTMLHLLLGIDPHSIGRAPFQPVFTGARYLPAGEIGLAAADCARLYCLPLVSGFIGADTVAGVLATSLDRGDGRRLFIDIGTNGEMVLSTPEGLWACSCAAGPAWEGMNISCGMRAESGAIDAVELADGRLVCRVIAGGAPHGLCGSGLIDAVAAGRRAGLIEPSGRIKGRRELEREGNPLAGRVREEEGKRIVLAEGAAGRAEVFISQADVRQMQLAKGAILTGFRTLLQETGLSFADLDELVIAGAFGSHLRLDSLVEIGLVPQELSGRVRYAGNTSLSGARLCLVSRQARQRVADIAGRIRHIELAVREGYEELFAASLYLQPI